MDFVEKIRPFVCSRGHVTSRRRRRLLADNGCENKSTHAHLPRNIVLLNYSSSPWTVLAHCALVVVMGRRRNLPRSILLVTSLEALEAAVAAALINPFS